MGHSYGIDRLGFDAFGVMIFALLIPSPTCKTLNIASQ